MFGQPLRGQVDTTIALVTGIITAVAIAQTGSMVTEEVTFSNVAIDFITVDITSDRLTSSHTSYSFTSRITLAMGTGLAIDFITVDITSDRLTSSHTSYSFTNHITLAMGTGRLSISITLASDLGCISVSRLIPLEDGAGDYTLLLAQNGVFRICNLLPVC
jgi:hypothetical protein